MISCEMFNDTQRLKTAFRSLKNQGNKSIFLNPENDEGIL